MDSERREWTRRYHQHEETATRALHSAQQRRDQAAGLFIEEEAPWNRHQSRQAQFENEIRSLDVVLRRRAGEMNLASQNVSMYAARSPQGQSARRRYQGLVTEQRAGMERMGRLRHDKEADHQRWMNYYNERKRKKEQLFGSLRRAVHAAQHHAHQAERLRLSTFGQHFPQYTSHRGRQVMTMDSGHAGAIDFQNGIFQQAGSCLVGPTCPMSGNPMWMLNPIPYRNPPP